MKLLIRLRGILFVGLFLFAQVLRATELELNLPEADLFRTGLTHYHLTNVNGVIRSSDTGDKELSPVVRLESRDLDFAHNNFARLGTGVVIGRFHKVDLSERAVFGAQEGVFVLTANHVLLESANVGENKVNLFNKDRTFYKSLDFKVFTISEGEDLALLAVPLSWAEAQKIQLPSLALYDPSAFVSQQWIPRYVRINPGVSDPSALTYSELIPRQAATMTTQDAVNSLAPMTDRFWYIAGDFDPGMSGGPVFLEDMLVGVMGYIFDRHNRYGYAYPFTKKSLTHLLEFQNSHPGEGYSYPLGETTFRWTDNLDQYRFLNSSMFVEALKKNGPDRSVADELRVLLSVEKLGFDGKGVTATKDEVLVEHLELRQWNEFQEEGAAQNLWPEAGGGRLRESLPEGGTPGGGVSDGSPGGGVGDGSPGGTPGTEKSQPSRDNYRSKHFVLLALHWSNGGVQRFILNRLVLEQGVVRKIEFIKDVLNALKDQKTVQFVIEPYQLKPFVDSTYKGQLDLNPLQKAVPRLASLGYLVSEKSEFQGKMIKTSRGITANLSTYFRDTRFGQTHTLKFRLGLSFPMGISKPAEALIASFLVDGKPLNFPTRLHYEWVNEAGAERLRVKHKGRIVMEVRL